MTYDTEYLADYATKVEYHEEYIREWEEWVPPTHDDKGRVHNARTLGNAHGASS